tara:strand:+ start:1824 stop:3077 length:1254 start_codon:yes stop_codon:yes gene_type:complete
MNVWIFQTGEPLQIDDITLRPMRAINLCNALIKSGHNVILWSSTFNHLKKIHRYKKFKIIKISEKLELRLIHSPGYKKNISISRLFDHLVMAYNLKSVLDKENKAPDVAFIGFPPIESAFIFTKWLNKKKIPSIIDVKDQWPTFFLNALPKYIYYIGFFFLIPYFLLAKYSMRNATNLSAIAEDFLDWALIFSNRIKHKNDLVAHLTTEKRLFPQNSINKANDFWKDKIDYSIKNRLIFVGTHYPSLDFETLINATKILNNEKFKFELIICGKGELTETLIYKSKGIKNIKFPGWVSRPQVEALAKISDATIAPFKNIDAYNKSLPNKVIDSLALSLPIITPLKGEVERLIVKEKVGLMYKEMSSEDLSVVIKNFYNDQKNIIKLKENAKTIFENKFSFDKVYSKIVGRLEKIAKKD